MKKASKISTTSRDRLLSPTRYAYDNLWADDHSHADSDASSHSVTNESGIASRDSTGSSNSRSSRSGAIGERAIQAVSSSLPAAVLRPAAPLVHMEDISLDKTDSFLQRLSWGSDSTYVSGIMLPLNNKPLAPWKGEYYEASTREFAASHAKKHNYYQTPDGTFDFSFSGLHEDDDASSIDNLLSRCLDKLDKVLMQVLEIICHEVDPEQIVVLLQRRRLFADHQRRRQRNRQQLAEACLTTLSKQTTSVILDICSEIVDKTTTTTTAMASANKSLKSFVECLLCLFNFIVRYTAGAEFCGRHQLDVLPDRLLALAVGEDEKPAVDLKLLYLDTNCDRLKPAYETMPIKKRKLMHDAFYDRKVSVRHEADKYVPVISLTLYAYALGQSEATELQQIFQVYPSSIVEFSLKKCRLQDATWPLLLASLRSSAKSLQMIDFHLTPVPDNVAKKFANSLCEMSCLRHLNVAGISSAKDSMAIIVKSMANCYFLSGLDLSFSQVEDSGASLLGDLLERGCPLTSLRLRNSHIKREGAKKLLNAMKRHPRLTYFDIGGNKIGSGTLCLLGENLICNRSIKEIIADDCGFSSDGCETLSRALKTNNVLQHLDISRNSIGDGGSNMLADSLKYNTALLSLGLNFCEVSNKGFSSLLDSLLSNVRLATLKLCYNYIGRQVCQSPCLSDDMGDADRESGIGRSTDETSQFGDELHTVDGNNYVNPSIGYCAEEGGGYTNEVCLYNCHLTDTAVSPIPTPTSKSIDSRNNSNHFDFDVVGNVYTKLNFVLQQNKTVKILLWGNNIDYIDSN